MVREQIIKQTLIGSIVPKTKNSCASRIEPSYRTIDTKTMKIQKFMYGTNTTKNSPDELVHAVFCHHAPSSAPGKDKVTGELFTENTSELFTNYKLQSLNSCRRKIPVQVRNLLDQAINGTSYKSY